MPIELLTAVIAAASVLAGSLLTALVTALTTRSADRRADARERARAEREEHEHQRRLADEVADAFRDELMTIRRHVQRDEDEGMPFDEVYADAWFAGIEMGLRQRVDRLSNRTLRRRLLVVLDCIIDNRVRADTGQSWERHVEVLLDLGRDLAMAEVRGQEPESDLVRDVGEYEQRLSVADRQREIERAAEVTARAAPSTHIGSKRSTPRPR
ncbi:MAG: hypothetical protein NT132_06145 [Microbacterium sp.]|uniref:hypothetical protein n=1 Tax=Microbacterium sp. TaxID=51671 RepID=UPI002635B8C3|nr:hypothetical protein [Microbacterium sp.]MCX6501976.1 hypothetical protein [Microbacterium sp.]